MIGFVKQMKVNYGVFDCFSINANVLCPNFACRTIFGILGYAIFADQQEDLDRLRLRRRRIVKTPLTYLSTFDSIRIWK